MEQLPIDVEILKKRSMIPKMIASLSYKNQELAIEYIRIWADKSKPITPLYEELSRLTTEEEQHVRKSE